MKNKRTSYFKQTSVLTSRYSKIFFNDKQNLLLTIAIPLLTILIVCYVACGDMFSIAAKVDHSINDGYPILAWQSVPQENDGEFVVNSTGIGNISSTKNPIVYIIFEKTNDYSKLENSEFVVKDNIGEEIFKSDIEDIEIVYGDDYTYSVYIPVNKDLDKNKKYSVEFTADVLSEENKYGNLQSTFDITIPSEYESVNSLVKTEGNGYEIDQKLQKNFDLNNYVRDNTQKIAALSKATMSIDGKDYVLISDAESLVFILSDKEKYGYDNEEWLKYNYYLNCDIDLNGYDKLTPFGSESNPYKGIFDGNGHIITNFTIDSTKKDVALFGVLDGTVKNIGIENAKISTTNKNCAVIAGTLENNATIYNCYISNSEVTADNGYAGSIAGNVGDEGKNVEIHTCYAKDVTLNTEESNVGGLIGALNNATLKACYAIPTIVEANNEENAGVIVGSYNSKANMEYLYYIKDNSDLEALGKNTSVNFCKSNNIICVEKDDFKEYSEKIIYNSENSEVDSEYGFKQDGQLSMFTGTQTGLFMLVCVAIFVGICNSIQEICKERNILKREYMTNLKLTSYMSSKLIIQGFVCAAQTLLILVIFAIYVKNKEMPSSGVIFHSIWTEYFITMFLLCFASDVIALVISAIVKNSSTANTFIPIILIVQIVFSGVLFDLGDVMDKFASLMVSKWGIAGLAISSRLNNTRAQFLLDSPKYELQLGSTMSSVKDLYVSSASNLLMVWCVLIAFIVICSALSTALLTRVKKDKR